MKDPVCSSVGKLCYHKKLINFCENNVKKAIGHTGTYTRGGGAESAQPNTGDQNGGRILHKARGLRPSIPRLFSILFLLLRLMNLPFVEKNIKNHTIFHDNICSVQLVKKYGQNRLASQQCNTIQYLENRKTLIKFYSKFS